MVRKNVIAGLFLGASLCVAAAAGLGPPLVCHPIQVGDAATIPWGSGAFEGKRGYNVKNLVADVEKALKDAPSVLVRMETLRRAAVYVSEGPSARSDLLARLTARALDAEAAGEPRASALAWFDAAYFVGCLDQLNAEDGGRRLAWGLADGVPGYAWMKRAISLAPEEPAMEFAAALLTHPGMHKGVAAQHEAHLRAAAAGATPGSLLEVNLAAHLSHWGRSLEQVRREIASRGSPGGLGDR